MVLAYKQKYKSMKQNRESLEINPHLHSQLMFDKGGKDTQWGKDSLFTK